MLLTEPPVTPIDFNFQLPGGIRVRVCGFFWIAALVLGWGFTATDPKLILLWAGAMFLSILIHELGHVLAFRRYGISSYIVLYHFGGLAVPDSYSFSSFGGKRLDSKAQIVVSAAGPAAQLILAAAVIFLVRGSGYGITYPGMEVFCSFILLDSALLWGDDPATLSNPLLNDLAFFILWPSIYWALLNLAPIYPLDGGQIAREALLLHDPHQGIRRSLILSIAAGIGLAVFAISGGQTFMAVMFGMLAFGSYQMLQQYSGRGGGFGGGFGGGGFGGGGGYGGGRGW